MPSEMPTGAPTGVAPSTQEALVDTIWVIDHPDAGRALDEATRDHQGLAEYGLMDRAVEALAQTLEPLIEEDMAQGGRLWVVCGRGDNGADGLGVAQTLRLAHPTWRLEVVLASGRQRPSVTRQRERFTRLPLKPTPEDPAALSEWLSVLTPPPGPGDVLIDALMGWGLEGNGVAPQSLEGQLIRWINQGRARGAQVISLDLPSGQSASGQGGTCYSVKADRTLMIGAPKLSAFLPDAGRAYGELTLVDIGQTGADLPADLPRRVPTLADSPRLITSTQARVWRGRRGRFDHKGTHGHALIVAGSPGMGGAALLTTGAALRSGAGLVTLATGAPGGAEALLTHYPEAMTAPLPDPTPDGWAALAHGRGLSAYRAVAFGPGMGRGPSTQELLSSLVDALAALPASERPTLVLDADGLNALVDRPALYQRLSGLGPTILTPHPGELDRMAQVATGHQIPATGYERWQLARAVAHTTGALVVLKGGATAVLLPGGAGLDRPMHGGWINTTGNPSLGAGGTGDVLTGIIAGLAARGLSTQAAACLGVWWHGRAADELVHVMDTAPEALRASDLIEALSREALWGPDRD